MSYEIVGGREDTGSTGRKRRRREGSGEGGREVGIVLKWKK